MRRPEPLEPVGGGSNPQPDDDQIGGDLRAVGEPHPLHAAVTDERVDADADPQVHAVASMQLPPARGQLLAQRQGQQPAGLLDQHDLESHRPATRGHLGADEPSPDDHHAGPRAQPLANREAVLDRAEQQHPLGHRAARPRARHGPAGDHETVERQSQITVFVAHRDGALRHVQPDRRGSPQHARAEVELGGHVDARAVHLAGEQLLRQRRPVVGGLAFGADDGEVAVVAVESQGFGGPHPGHAGPDHDHLAQLIRRHGLSPSP